MNELTFPGLAKALVLECSRYVETVNYFYPCLNNTFPVGKLSYFREACGVASVPCNLSTDCLIQLHFLYEECMGMRNACVNVYDKSVFDRQNVALNSYLSNSLREVIM